MRNVIFAVVICFAAVGYARVEIPLADKRLERSYVLPHAKAEILATLLKLDLPANTDISTRKGKMGLTTVTITAPERTHSIVAPFIRLVDEKRLAAEKRSEQKAIERTSKEYYDRHIKPFKKP